MGTFLKKHVKKRAIKLPVAVLVYALLVVGGGITAYKAVADSNILIAPNGGENWSGEQQITWDIVICGTEEGQTEYIDLKYTSGGSPILIKSNVVCSGGSYNWNTTNVGDGNNYQIVLYYTNDYSTNDNSDNPFTIDNTDPISEVTDNLTTYQTNATFNISYTADDNLSGVDYVELYYSKDGAGFEKYGDFTASPISFDSSTTDGDGVYGFYTVAVDNAGNTEIKTTADASTIVDTILPTITDITSEKIDGSYKAGETIDIDITFSEIVTSTGDVTVTLETGSTDQTCTFSVTGLDTGTCNYVVKESDVSADLNVLSVAGTITDVAGNVMTVSVPEAGNNLADNKNIVIDTAKPTVAITTSESDPTNTNPIPVIIIFNEGVVGFVVGDITVSNGVVNNLQTSDNTIFTADIAPAGDGPVIVNVAAGVAQDLAGNDNIIATQFSITYDGTPPNFNITDGASTSWTASDAVTFTVSYAVAGASGINDYVFTNTATCNDTVTFSGTPTFELGGDTITVANEDKNGKYLCLRANDLAGNIAYQSVGPFKIDTVPAIISITENVDGNYVQSDNVQFTVNYTTSGAGDTEYILTTGACDSNVSFTEATDYTSGANLTFNDEANNDGKYVCLRARDGKGDEDPVETYTYLATGQLKIDNTAPTNVTDLTSTNHTESTWNKLNNIILTWTDAVDTKSGLDGYSVVCDTTVGTLPDEVLDIEENIVTYTCNDVADGSSIYFHIRSVDILGNWALGAEHIGPFYVDASNPTVDVGADVIANAEFTQDATVSAVISGVASYSWTQESGTGTITFGSANAVNTTILADIDGTYTIRLTVVDNAGNSASDTMTLIWDKTDPTFTIGSDNNGIDLGPVQTDTIVIHVVDENYGGVSIIQYGFGDTTACTGVSYEYSFISGNAFTITGDHKDYLCVKYTDAAGNTGDDSFGPLNTDNTDPIATVTRSVDPINKTNLIQTVTVTYDEPMNPATSPAIILTGSNWGVQTPIGWTLNDTVYTATFTHNGVEEEITSMASVATASGATDVAGNTEVGDDSLEFEVDTKVPTVTITSTELNPTNFSPFQVVITFSEAVADFIVGDIAVGNSTADNFNATNNPIFTADITPTSDGAVTVDVVAGVAQDLAGNDNTIATQFSITYDATDPTIDNFIAPVADAVYKIDPPLQFTPNDTGTAVNCSYAINGGIVVPVACVAGTAVDTTITGLTDGRNSLVVTVTDEAGNSVDSSPVSFVYDDNNTLTVGVSGYDFTTIQEAVNKATAGDTIEVMAGIYEEGVVIDKSLTLQGSGKDNTTISKSVKISANAVTLTGFKIIADSILGEVAGIYIQGNLSNVLISDNEIDGSGVSGNPRGILTATGSNFNNVRIEENKIHDCTTGIYTNPHTGVIDIENNEIYNTVAGIGGLMGANVRYNIFYDNDEAIGADASITGSTYVIEFNKFLGDNVNAYVGVLVVAEKNWWGSNQKSDIEAMISGDVDFDPWYLDEEMTILSDSDLTGPTVVLTNNIGGEINIKQGDEVEIIATFSDYNGLDTGVTPTIAILNGDVVDTDMTSTGDPDIWTYLWTVPSGNATAEITIAAKDIVGNDISETTGVVSYTIDNTGPFLSEVTPVLPALGNNPTPSYTFSSTEAGVITYGGGCSSAATDANVGDNLITFNGLGDDTYNCTIIVTDLVGNPSNILSVTEFIVDTTAPEIAYHDDIIEEAISPAGAIVTYTNPTAEDLVDGDVEVICSPVSGFEFPLGATTVNCSAADTAGNTATSDFTITVVDTTKPVIVDTPEDITAEATSPAGAVVTYTNPTATDLVDGNVDVTCGPASGSEFPLGATIITCTATDDANNTATFDFTITVEDTTPPEIVNQTPTGIVNYTNPTISADFSEDVSGVDISGVTIQVTGGSINFDESYFTVTESGFTSNTSGVNLDKNTTYSVVVSGLKDSAGNITGEKSWSFTISKDASEVDEIAPTALNWTPANGSENVDVNTNIVLNFNEKLAATTDTVEDKFKLRPYDCENDTCNIAITTTYNNDKQVVINPDELLGYEQSYFIYIVSTLQDIAGNDFGSFWQNANQDDHEFTTEEELAEDNPITSYEISLNQGWNLISLPLIPTDSAIATVLANISDNVEIVWYYNAGNWLFYDPANITGSNLATMEDGKGYWIFMNNADNLIGSGSETIEGGGSPLSYQLAEDGWNLIGFKSTEEMIAGDYVRDFTDKTLNENSILWNYKNGSYPSTPLHSSDDMEPGYGYWLLLK